MKIAICDDSIACVNEMEEALEKISKTQIECDVYFCGEKLIAAYKKNEKPYDVIFLDIEMDMLNGMETAKLIRELDEHIIIVFVTSHSRYMKESFKYQPFRFIEKPIAFEELKEVFADISKKISQKRKVFAFTENKAKVRLYCDDIIYCESQAHWIWLYTKEQSYKLCKSMTELQEMLDREMLFRVHKSFIINFRYVKSIRENEIQLYHCKQQIPIGRAYKKAVIAEYTNFVERNLYI